MRACWGEAQITFCLQTRTPLLVFRQATAPPLRYSATVPPAPLAMPLSMAIALMSCGAAGLCMILVMAPNYFAAVAGVGKPAGGAGMRFLNAFFRVVGAALARARRDGQAAGANASATLHGQAQIQSTNSLEQDVDGDVGVFNRDRLRGVVLMPSHRRKIMPGDERSFRDRRRREFARERSRTPQWHRSRWR